MKQEDPDARPPDPRLTPVEKMRIVKYGSPEDRKLLREFERRERALKKAAKRAKKTRASVKSAKKHRKSSNRGEEAR